MSEDKPREVTPEQVAPTAPNAGRDENKLMQLAMLGFMQRFVLAAGGVATISFASIPDEIPLQFDIVGDICTIRAGVAAKRKGNALVTGRDAESVMDRLKSSSAFRRH